VLIIAPFSDDINVPNTLVFLHAGKSARVNCAGQSDLVFCRGHDVHVGQGSCTGHDSDPPIFFLIYSIHHFFYFVKLR
jgi:hypothetical protein